MQIKSHGMMFHHFHNQLHIKGQGSIDGDKFNDMLVYYSRRYNLLSAQEYYDKTQKGTLNEEDTVITFDDGLKCQYDVAYPVLKNFGTNGITAFFFVYSSPLIGGIENLEIYRHFRFLCFNDINEFYKSFFEIVFLAARDINIDVKKSINAFDNSDYFKQYHFYTDEDRKFRYFRNEVLKTSDYDYIMHKMLDKHNYSIKENKCILWMNSDEIKDLRKSGNIIGLHSHTHPTRLEKLSYEEQYNEYKLNKDILENILDEQILTASYPCDSYNNDTINIMKKLGIKFGFKANMLKEPSSVYEILRQDHANILKEMQI